jgi:diacylglycerol kinase family enzyme
MISAGFDAEVVRQVSELRGGHITRWTYAKPIWRAIRSYTYPLLRVYCDTGRDEALQRHETTARWVFGLNLPQYARGLQFCPAASGDDGLLDVCLLRRGGFLRGVWYLLNVIARRHGSMRDCEMLRCERLRIEADEPVTYQIDGDHGGWLPVEVELLRQRVRLVVPRTYLEGKS